MNKLLFILASLTLFTGFTIHPKLEEHTWSKPINGIQAMLYSPKPEYSAGEKIELRVRLRNTTQQKLTVDPKLFKTVYIRRNGKPEEEYNCGDTLPNNEINLAPGEARDFFIFYFGAKDGAGIYDFSGVIGDLQLPQIQILVKDLDGSGSE